MIKNCMYYISSNQYLSSNGYISIDYLVRVFPVSKHSHIITNIGGL